MKKKATLLIKNIERVYTMREVHGKQLILRHAYIAIHHEEILAVACGDFSSYLDKDTRVIDAMSHIAVPGFLEPFAKLPTFDERDVVRKQQECLMQYMHHGTLSVHLEEVHPQLMKHYAFEVLQDRKENGRYPIIYGVSQLQKNARIAAKNFCISSYAEGYTIYDQLTIAQMLGIRYGLDAMSLLKSLTIHPARRMGIRTCGILEEEMQADLLLLSCESIQEFFHGLGNDAIAHIVKKGVRIFPNILI